MQIPSAIDVLYSIEKTLDAVVRPRASGTAELSALATTGHLLRHVALRIEREGQNCLDDIAGMRRVLIQVREYCRTSRSPQAGACAEAAARSLDAPPRDPAVYPTLDALAAEASTCRRALAQALDALIAMRATDGELPAYRELRQLIREQLAAEIRREAALIDPAFDGKGPRR